MSSSGLEVGRGGGRGVHFLSTNDTLVIKTVMKRGRDSNPHYNGPRGLRVHTQRPRRKVKATHIQDVLLMCDANHYCPEQLVLHRNGLYACFLSTGVTDKVALKGQS